MIQIAGTEKKHVFSGFTHFHSQKFEMIKNLIIPEPPANSELVGCGVVQNTISDPGRQDHSGMIEYEEFQKLLSVLIKVAVDQR